MYEKVQKQQAILGNDLAEQLGLLRELSKVPPSLLFKHCDLKQVFDAILLQDPCMKARFELREHQLLPGRMARLDALKMTLNSNQTCRRLEQLRSLTAHNVDLRGQKKL